MVKDLNDLSHDAYCYKLAETFEIEMVSEKPCKAVALHEFGMCIDGNWYKVTSRHGPYISDPISVLDVSILQNNILGSILGIHDQGTEIRIDFVGGIRGLEVLAQG